MMAHEIGKIKKARKMDSILRAFGTEIYANFSKNQAVDESNLASYRI
jgi:hypothetical protein